MPNKAIGGLIIVFAAMFFFAGAVSAKVLTLDECIELALKNHFEVVQARGQVKIADGNVWQAFGAFLPYISASALDIQNNGEDFINHVPKLHLLPDSFVVPIVTDSFLDDDFKRSFSMGFSAELTLFNGGQNIFNYMGAKADKSYYEYLKEQTEQGLIFTVKTTYFAYLAAIKSKEIQDEALKRAEEQLKLANSRFEVGSASKSDVLKAKVQYGQDKLALLDADNGIRIARSNLAYQIGIDVNSDIEFSRDYKRGEYNGSEENALKFGMTHHPGLLANEKNLEAAKYDIRSTRGRYFPTLSVSISKDWSNSRWSVLNDFKDIDASWSLQTRLSIPIFENFSRKASMSRSKAGMNNARANYYYAKNSVAYEVKKAYLEITRTQEALKVADETELAAKEDMTIVQEKYNLGAATILELLDAQVSLITAQNTKIQTEFDYNIAVAKLENAMGLR
jgi:outer membrane protein TolC